MRRASVLSLAVLGFLVSSSPAAAANLTDVTWVGTFQGTPFTLVANSSGLMASGTVAAGEVVGFEAIVDVAPMTSLDTTGAAPVFISQTLGGSQTFNSANGVNQGISGAVRVYIGSDNTGALLYSVPLSVGMGGTFQGTSLVPGLSIPVQVTATFFPWTTGSHVFTGLTSMGVALPDVTLAGSNGGVFLSLVAPTVISVCAGSIFGTLPCVPGAAGNDRSSRTVSATRLSMGSISGPVLPPLPEPGTVLLLAAGLVGLASRKRQT